MSSLLRRMVLALAAAILLPAAAPAQTASPSAVVARPGELIRLRTAQWEYTGRLLSVGRDTTLVLAGSDTARVATLTVRRVQVQRGTRRSAARIALFSAAGAAAGTLVGSIGTFYRGELFSDDPASGWVSAATAGAFVGAIGGGVWGAQKRYPRWLPGALAP